MTTTVCAQDVYGIMGCVRLLGNKATFLEAIDVRSCVFVAHMKKQSQLPALGRKSEALRKESQGLNPKPVLSNVEGSKTN